jgi:hypothetical protein
LLVFFVGAVIVVIDGQLILRNSPSYLAEAYHDPRQAKRVSGLVAGFFHLVMLGVVALVASINMDDQSGVPTMLSRIGFLLILTAVAHAVTVVVLSRLRDQQTGTELAEAQIAAEQAHGQPEPPPRAANGADPSDSIPTARTDPPPATRTDPPPPRDLPAHLERAAAADGSGRSFRGRVAYSGPGATGGSGESPSEESAD